MNIGKNKTKQKETDIEKKFDELSKTKDSSDGVCEDAEKEMYTASGRGEEDNLSSISAISQREERVGTELREKAATRAAAKKTLEVKVTFESRFKVLRRMYSLC